jgi:hypothetical protein
MSVIESESRVARKDLGLDLGGLGIGLGAGVGLGIGGGVARNQKKSLTLTARSSPILSFDSPQIWPINLNPKCVMMQFHLQKFAKESVRMKIRRK